jgi:acetyl esterase
MAEPSTFADEGIARFVAAATLGGELNVADIAGLRAGAAVRARERPPGPALEDVRDLRVPTCPARLFRPFAAAQGPLIVWLHGGGFVFGGVETHDRQCRLLAATAGVAVLSLDYRLAPEHPWPAALDDAVAALEWVAARPVDGLGFQPTAVGVGGDSAGGTLAALACLRLRDAHRSALPRLQVLAYANVDLACDRPSMHDKASGWGLDADAVGFFNRQWVADESRWTDPDVSPLYAPDLRELPEAVIVTAEHDVLRDQGEAYAKRLRAADVPVSYRCEPGLIHNFLLIDLLSPAAAQAGVRLADDIRERLSGEISG